MFSIKIFKAFKNVLSAISKESDLSGRMPTDLAGAVWLSIHCHTLLWHLLPASASLATSLTGIQFHQNTWQKYSDICQMSSSISAARKCTFWHNYVPNEGSNQSAHPHSLNRVIVVRMKILCNLGYPKCAQWRFRSDCANAQADLNLQWAQISGGTVRSPTLPLNILLNVSWWRDGVNEKKHNAATLRHICKPT